MRVLLAIAALMASQVQAAEEVRFVACPVYRDTDAGKKSGCWLADDPQTGRRYDVSASASKPDWNYAVLVEGKPSADPVDHCGGETLAPVRTSILDTPCPRHSLLDEGFPGHRFVLPKRNVEPQSVKRPTPVPPYEDRVFRLFFDWNSSFIAYQREDWSLDQTIGWIRAVKVKSITVVGYGATEPSSVSGLPIAEQVSIARQRADHVADALADLGIARDQIRVMDGGAGFVVDDAWVDGLAEPSRRRVEIKVELAP